MKIRMLTGVAGKGFSAKAGDEVEFPEHIALRYLETAQAVPVVERKSKKTEKATRNSRRKNVESR